MQLPAMVRGDSGKRLIQGALLGGVATVIVGFVWGGWLLGSTASRMALVAADAARIEVLAPICVAQFNAIDGALAKFQAAVGYNRDTVVRESMKTVGGTEMSWPLARECQKLLEAQINRSAASKT
jgi:hypothetical protein